MNAIHRSHFVWVPANSPWPSWVRWLAIGLFASTLAACGSDDAPSPSAANSDAVSADGGAFAPVEPDGDDHDHGAGDLHIESLGRLAVQEAGVASVRIVELDDSRVLTTIATSHPVSSLYASPGRRYAVAIQRDQDLVEFIDGGLWQEDHVDHLHDYRTDPKSVEFRLNGIRPTHFESHDELSAVFNDGFAASNINAGIMMISDVGVSTGRIEASLALPMQMHGTAEPRGRFLLTTWRAPDNVDTLPEKVELYEFQNGGYQFVTRFEPACPALHGSFSNETHSAFGCSDGVLLVTQSGADFTATKIPNPVGLPADVRIGTITGHHARGSFVGFASPGYLFEIDPAVGEIRSIAWPGQRRVASSFDSSGNTLIAMDEGGSVHLLDGRAGWAVKASVPAATGVPTEGSAPTIEPHADQPLAYVSDPLGQRVVIVNTESGLVSGAIGLDFAPGQIRWLGIAEHDHE